MKKIYTILLASFPLIGFSQTIYQADLPAAGDAYLLAADSTYSAPIPPGGTGQSWNYTGLLDVYHDTTIFEAAAGTPYASLFSSSNLASFNASNNSYTYFTSNSTGIYVDGQASSSSTFQPSPSILYIPVPFSMGDSRNSTSRIQQDFVDSSLGTPTNYRIVITFDSHFEADGSGTLDIPSGNFGNVLRIKQTQLIYDSLYVEILGFFTNLSSSVQQSTNYLYVTSGLQNNYLLGIAADSLGTTATSSEYFLSNFSASIPSFSNNNDHHVYPNPAFGSIKHNLLNQNPEIIIYDSNGRKVLNSQFTFGESLNVESLSEGIYFYELLLKNG